jgi:two-component system, chemotaxis family, protein-glutamate methylesterase/glutaminase
MTAPRIVVVGASAGGIDALRALAKRLPADFPAPICVVLHVSPDSPGIVASIISRSGVLPAAHARHGERLQAGRIYVAPTDRHLLVEPGRLHLSRGPKENRFRPAIDPLFRSAARVYGPGTVGVILSGNLDDGTAGLRTIKQLGGVAIVQDPADALFPSMPRSALAHVAVDHLVPIEQLAALLTKVVNTAVTETSPVAVPKDVEVEVKIAGEENAIEWGLGEISEPSVFSCPECHGVLLRLKASNPARFRCHTGHAFTIDSLTAAVSESIDDSLWTAIRALQEGTMLLEHLAHHLRETGSGVSAELIDQIASIKAQSAAVRQVVNQRAGLMTSTSEPARA